MKRPLAYSWDTLGPVALALSVGTIGGALFTYLGSPLPWMLGAMCATTVAAVSGATIRIPNGLRWVMLSVLGMMLGSAFTPHILERSGQWIGSLATLFVFIVFVAGTLACLLRRIAGFDAATAYFSASPGGLSEMVTVGGAMGGDERTISLVHAVRLLLTVLVIPLWFRLFQGYEPSVQGSIGNMSWAIAPGDAIVLGLCAVTGYWAAKRTRVPAPALTGPLVFSALVHLGGLTAATPPGFLTALAQVIIGTSIGCRFSGIAVREMRDTLVTGALSTLLMLALAVIFALILEAGAGLPFAALLLAFAPGGLAEMSLISLSLGIDAAFVSTHQVVRIFFIVALFPLAFRFLAGPPSQR